MKQRDCSDFLEDILTVGTPLSAAAEAHVKTCPECARLRADAIRFAVTSLEREVPENIDRAVLKHAASAVRKRSKTHWLFRRVLPCGAAAAAAAVLCIAVLTPENELASGKMAAPVLASAAINSEWSAFEREAFDLNQELTSCQNAVAAWQSNMETWK